MSVLPKTVTQSIQFCETHLPVWEAAPATIGLSPAQVADLAARTLAAREALEQAHAARSSAKARTIALSAATRGMREAAADLIRQIKAFAELQADPVAVYGAAEIPPPAAPSPIPAPARPTAIAVTLESTGAITLSWEAGYGGPASSSSGAFYTVSRQLPGEAGFTSIGGAPGTTSQSRRMYFTDTTLPSSAAAGGSGVRYLIQGRRGLSLGEVSTAITVQFGAGESGGAGLSVRGATGVVRMAA